MFSGIVETIGTISFLEDMSDCVKIKISPHLKFPDLNIGDSVSVNGVCLTITEYSNDDFNVTVVPETLRLTNLKNYSVGTCVNLERSLKVGSRIGGHYVQGHIDCTGEILDIQADGSKAIIVKISLPQKLAKYIVNKGYIGLDGMSITVIETGENWFTVTLIPHTQDVTIANTYCVGTNVNLEVDILGKYAEKLLGVH